jgi:hypothetical protein
MIHGLLGYPSTVTKSSELYEEDSLNSTFAIDDFLIFQGKPNCRRLPLLRTQSTVQSPPRSGFERIADSGKATATAPTTAETATPIPVIPRLELILNDRLVPFYFAMSNGTAS